jgi:aspartyl-tRNA(Asn)/glutamyl-tRNA(Gln) amidotransferase subunit A
MTGSKPELYATIRETARQFRTGSLSPVELARASIDRIGQIDPALHAFVEVAADAAVASAQMAESRIRQRSAASLLCGVPFAVKDIVDVAGLPTRCGSRTRDKSAPAKGDAVVVARLADAGGVMVGKTVTQEFAAGTLSPPARNPWDPTRVPGGSSGGSAVAVATGAAMSAIGTDTGGSVRNPAAICGVVGLKPTFGSIPTTGVYPLSWSLDTIGPLARTVDDAWLTFNVMSGQGDESPLNRDLRGIRIGQLGGYFRQWVDPETLAALDAAGDVLRGLGAEVLELDWEDAAAARASSFIINRLETVAVHEALLRDGEGNLDLLNQGLRLRLVAGQFIPAIAYVRAERARLGMRDSVARLFAQHRLDAVMTPVSAATAVDADRPVVTWDDGVEEAGHAYTRLTQPFNATGQPAISVPAGFDAAGLPIGLQLAGKPHQERQLCQIAHAFEQDAGWHQRRPPL